MKSSKSARRGSRLKSVVANIVESVGQGTPSGTIAYLALLLFLVVAMTFGGGPGGQDLPFWAISLTGLLLLVSGVAAGWLVGFQSLPLLFRIAVGAAVALPFFQLIPLPPALWQSLPGNGLRVEILTAFGLGSHWLPLSITPADTAYSAVMALCMLGLFLGLLALPESKLRGLLWLVVLVIAAGVVLGLVQYSSNGTLGHLYRRSHYGSLTGFFANKNHMGLTLACVIPLAYVLLKPRLDALKGAVGALAILWLAVLALLVATNSRAGIVLGLLAIFLTCLYQYPGRRIRVTLVSAAAVGVLLAIAAFVPAIGEVVDRFGQSGEDVRIGFFERTVPLMQQYGWLGSGLGSFTDVYLPTEALGWVTPLYLNAAHDDFVQIVIEAGMPGILVLILLAAAVAKAAFPLVARRLRPAAGGKKTVQPDAALLWLGLVIILLFGLHSIVDYPARRIASLVLLVLGLALVFRPYVVVRNTVPAVLQRSRRRPK